MDDSKPGIGLEGHILKEEDEVVVGQVAVDHPQHLPVAVATVKYSVTQS